jgi:hypothetical protein
MLIRGHYVLPGASQAAGRDPVEADMGWMGGEALLIYVKTDADMAERGPNASPYRFVATYSGIAWTALLTREALDAYIEAYGITVEPYRDQSPLTPGSRAWLRLPKSTAAFKPLVDAEVTEREQHRGYVDRTP